MATDTLTAADRALTAFRRIVPCEHRESAELLALALCAWQEVYGDTSAREAFLSALDRYEAGEVIELPSREPDDRAAPVYGTTTGLAAALESERAPWRDGNFEASMVFERADVPHRLDEG